MYVFYLVKSEFILSIYSVWPALKHQPCPQVHSLFNYFLHVFYLFQSVFYDICWSLNLFIHQVSLTCPEVPTLNSLFNYFLHGFYLFNHVCILFIETYIYLFTSEFIYPFIQVPTLKSLFYYFIYLNLYLFKPVFIYLKADPSACPQVPTLCIFIQCKFWFISIQVLIYCLFYLYQVHMYLP
jgi:hypothetical protein